MLRVYVKKENVFFYWPCYMYTAMYIMHLVLANLDY